MPVARKLLRYVKPYWLQVLSALAAMGVVSLVNLALPLLFGQGVFQRILIEGQDLGLLTLLALGMVGLVLAKGIASYFQVYSTSYVGQRVVLDLRNQLYEHLQRLSLGFHQRRRVGDLISRVTGDAGLIQHTLGIFVTDLVQQVLMLSGVVGLLLYLNARLSLLTFVVFVLVALTINRYGGRIRRISTVAQEKLADITTVLQETLQGIRVVKAFQLEERASERFRAGNEQNFRAHMRSVRLSATLVPVVELLVAGGMTAVLWLGGRDVVAGRWDPGDFLAFLAYLAMAIHPISTLTRTLSLFQQALAAAERIFQVMDEDPEVPEMRGAVVLPRVRGRVRFGGVWFAYRGEDWVLQDVDFEAEPGEVVAVVGASGAGKSTLVNLLPRFYDPTRGVVEIDGHDLRRLQLRSLRDQIGLVPQETVLFGVSVRENIAYGRPGAREREIEAAARAANAHEFVVGLPQGYDTILGQDGVDLSGGQRQRVAIARAVLRDPRILILDEATSALDAESEQLIQEALARLMQGRTTFVIAHRLSTVLRAHRVLVLEAGRVAQVGTHPDLLRRGGVYRRLFESQFSQEAAGR